ncbi:MAG: CDP-alcohol phosphatidyltransferase family protein [Pseudomonadota bacterium]
MKGWRWRYVPPNLLTCTSLVVALFSISESIARDFKTAAWMLVLCVLLDKADGFTARLFKASSRFGVELDSLADLIAFGVAPAVFVLSLLLGEGLSKGLENMPEYRRLIYVGCFFYVVAAALRLAKFNVMTEEYGHSHFFGIPTTLCGGVIGCYFLTVERYGLPAEFIRFLPGLMIILGLLMVSRLPLPKFVLGKSPIRKFLAVANVIGVYFCGIVRVYPEYLLVLTVTYITVGTLWCLAKGVKPPVRKAPDLSVEKEESDKAEDELQEEEEDPEAEAHWEDHF